jgi:hypothetical protein
MNVRQSVLPILLLLSLGLSGCHRERTTAEATARTLGQKALTRYCERKAIPTQAFALSQIGPEGDFPWVLVYVSSGSSPALEFVVSIDKYGGLEASASAKH